MAPDPEGILKTLIPTKDDWRLVVGGVGALNAGWLNGFVGKYAPQYAPETMGLAASWAGYKLVPAYFKGAIGEAAKSFFLGTLFVNIGMVGKKYVPQIEFKVTQPAGMPESYGYPEPPAAPPAPQTIEELAALEAQTRPARYYGR